MNWHKFSPVVLTLLVFLLAQGLGTILLLCVGMMVSPEFNAAIRAFVSGDAQNLPMFEQIPVSAFSLILMAVDIIAVLLCYFLLRNIRLVTAHDVASIRWRPGSIAILAGILGAFCTSILTENVPLPDVMQQMSLAMAHNFWGLIAIVIVGPVTEELLFREAIEGEMLRRGASPWTAIIVSAIAFSIAHLNLAQGLYALPLAILFGIIYYKTRNILLTSLLHVLNNGIAALQFRTFGEGINDLSYADWFGGTKQACIAMLITGVLSLILTKIFWDWSQSSEIQKNTHP